MRLLVNACTVCALCIAAAACELFYDRSLTWTEQVKQPDGSVIVVTREQEFRDRNYDVGDHRLEFKHPKTGEYVRWYGHRHLNVVALLTVDSDTFLLAIPTWGSSEQFLNCPNPPYLLYRFRDTWSHIPLSEVPVKELRPNVLAHVWLHIDEIKKSNWNVPVPVTITQSQTYNRQPWIIDFGSMTEQTFGKNCGRAANMLIKKVAGAT